LKRLGRERHIGGQRVYRFGLSPDGFIRTLDIH